MILSLCIDTLKTQVSVRGYKFFCPCPETNIASIVSGKLFVHVSMVYELTLYKDVYQLFVRHTLIVS